MENNDLFKELETERLYLKKIDVSYAKDLYDNIYHDIDYYKYYYSVAFENFEEYQKLIETYAEYYLKGNYFRWGLVLKETNEMIGMVQLHGKDTLNDSCKLGYTLGKKYQGNGYMKEALEKIIDFTFTSLPVHRIEAEVVTENKKSLKLVKKLNMTYEGIRRESYKYQDNYYNQAIFSLINSKNNI